MLQDQRDLQIDLSGSAQARTSRAQAPLELGELLGGGGQALLASRGLVQRQQAAPDPDDGVQLGRGEFGLEDVPQVARAVGLTRIGPIPHQLPGRCLGLQPLAELPILLARARQDCHEAPTGAIDMGHVLE